ncbi:hypothetical protein DPX39_090030400 [Trypanosoma brucei equiperdum]|uniref:Uncharacterized protein n=1 Tax=Trypanosoma brucei equiperdum TaxID=630700 RepID=A0A3L6L2A7_9TRYP|nr:hypothetical protein DPX39_090030400 [Trypanosoma brucei equiperdum]
MVGSSFSSRHERRDMSPYSTRENLEAAPVPQRWSLLFVHRHMWRTKRRKVEENNVGGLHLTPSLELEEITDDGDVCLRCSQEEGTERDNSSENERSSSPVPVPLNSVNPQFRQADGAALPDGDVDTLGILPSLAHPVVLGKALDAIELVAKHVQHLHCTKCPLCGPPKPPTWWSTPRARRRLRREDNQVGIRSRADWEAGETSHNKENISSPSSLIGAVPQRRTVAASSTCCSHKDDVRRAHVLSKAEQFLQHIYDRRNRLIASRPLMYAVPAESHVLWRECSQLGGVALLEALLLGFTSQEVT